MGTEDERLKEIEIAQVQLQKDFSILVSKQTETFNSQIQLDKTMSSVLAKLDARFDEVIQLEKTIRHFDDTIKDLSLKFERSPIEHSRLVAHETDKIWDNIRKQDSKFNDFKDRSHEAHTNLAVRIKAEIMTTAKNHINLLYACILIGSVMVGAFYIDIKDDIKTNHTLISDHDNKDKKK